MLDDNQWFIDGLCCSYSLLEEGCQWGGKVGEGVQLAMCSQSERVGAVPSRFSILTDSLGKS
jgi:hypothetical protein